MDLRLQFLESFHAAGSDGGDYKVCAYDRLAPDGAGHWEPTGVAEYRLADGRCVQAGRDGELRIAGTPVVLTPAPATA